MGKRYHHLTEQGRICLRVMLERHYSTNKIAETLGVHRSTVYRELKRNSQTHWKTGIKFYWSCFAQEKYLKRRKRSTKLEKNNSLKDYVHSKLRTGWSPWQIEGRLKLENADRCMISHETIYRYIYHVTREKN